MTLLVLFFRSFLQVALIALNVRHITHGRYGAAFITGLGISAVWWLNAHSAAHEPGILPLLAYASGAGVGTVAGMYLSRKSKPRV